MFTGFILEALAAVAILILVCFSIVIISATVKSLINMWSNDTK